jgi:hypothetical protein
MHINHAISTMLSSFWSHIVSYTGWPSPYFMSNTGWLWEKGNSQPPYIMLLVPHHELYWVTMKKVTHTQRTTMSNTGWLWEKGNSQPPYIMLLVRHHELYWVTMKKVTHTQRTTMSNTGLLCEKSYHPPYFMNFTGWPWEKVKLYSHINYYPIAHILNEHTPWRWP